MRPCLTVCCLFLVANVPFNAHSLEHEVSAQVRSRAAFIEGERDGRSASIGIQAGLNSAWQNGLSSRIEFEHVASFWENDFDNGLRNNNKPIIPDVDVTELNQLALGYEGEQWSVFVGRERSGFDNERFIGDNGFWQDDQTFDGLSAQYEFFAASKLEYRFINQANRIFGDENTGPEGSAQRSGAHKHASHLVNLNVRDWDYQNLSVFYYDIDNKEIPSVSNKTFGFFYEIEKHAAFVRPSLQILAAQQKRIEADTQSSYFQLQANLGLDKYRLSYRFEYVGTDENMPFITPLASLHDFHGWVDKFGNPPAEGLLDQSVAFVFRKSPIKLDFRYHRFASIEGNLSFGEEYDLDFIYKFNKQNTIFIRYADFLSDQSTRDRFPSETRIYFNYVFRY